MIVMALVAQLTAPARLTPTTSRIDSSVSSQGSRTGRIAALLTGQSIGSNCDTHLSTNAVPFSHSETRTVIGHADASRGTYAADDIIDAGPLHIVYHHGASGTRHLNRHGPPNSRVGAGHYDCLTGKSCRHASAYEVTHGPREGSFARLE